MFDKPSDWTLSKWITSKAYHIMERAPSDEFNWIHWKDMTAEERKEHPEAETTYGFLKVEKVTCEARQKWWNELSEYDKNEVLSLPNFDANKFKSITEIDING